MLLGLPHVGPLLQDHQRLPGESSNWAHNSIIVRLYCYVFYNDNAMQQVIEWYSYFKKNKKNWESQDLSFHLFLNHTGCIIALTVRIKIYPEMYS